MHELQFSGLLQVNRRFNIHQQSRQLQYLTFRYSTVLAWMQSSCVDWQAIRS